MERKNIIRATNQRNNFLTRRRGVPHLHVLDPDFPVLLSIDVRHVAVAGQGVDVDERAVAVAQLPVGEGAGEAQPRERLVAGKNGKLIDNDQRRDPQCDAHN